MVTATFLGPINKDPDLLDVHGPLLTESGQPDSSLSLSQPASRSSTNYLIKDHYWGVQPKHLLDFFEEKNKDIAYLPGCTSGSRSGFRFSYTGKYEYI